MSDTIAALRLWNQRLSHTGLRRPEDVVGWFGAVQAQEYGPAKWGIGLRLQDGAVDAAVERAVDAGRILRTHVMRPTWHFVAPADIRWLLALTAPRVRRIMAPYDRRLELDAPTIARGRRVMVRALRDGHFLTRGELADRLEQTGLPTVRGQRLAQMMMHAELDAVVCSGPRRGKQSTYGLVDLRAPQAREWSRDESLAELSLRFFRSHGPATARDFSWWSGLTMSDAKRGLEIIRARRVDADGVAYWTVGSAPHDPARDHLVRLLPIYDEYLVAYKDRRVVPHGPPAIQSRAAGTVTFQHALVIAGQVAGTWRLSREAGGSAVRVTPLRPLTRSERAGLADAVKRYEAFVEA